MFRPMVPYEEAVFSDNPDLRELARITASARPISEKGHFNYAARSAIREGNQAVYSKAVRSQGSNAGAPLHPDRTTEIALYNKLIGDPKTKAEWREFSPMKIQPINTPWESSQLLGRHRSNFSKQRYRTQLFSELHPCSTSQRSGAPMGCDPYLRETLNPYDEVYHSVPYVGVGDIADRIQAAHLPAREAMIKAGLLPPPKQKPYVKNFYDVESAQPAIELSSDDEFGEENYPRGPIDRFLTRAPHNIPSDVAIPIVSEWRAPSTQSHVNLHTSGSLGLGYTPALIPREEKESAEPKMSLLEALKPENRKPQHPHYSSSSPDESLSDKLLRRGRSASPVQRDREQSPSPLRSESVSPEREREASPFNFRTFRGNNFALGDYKYGGPVTTPKVFGKKSPYKKRVYSTKKGMNIFERMLLGYV